MEPYSSALTEILQRRLDEISEDERRVALSWIAGARPVFLVQALEYATRLRDEVDETLRR